MKGKGNGILQTLWLELEGEKIHQTSAVRVLAGCVVGQPLGIQRARQDNFIFSGLIESSGW